MVVNTPGIYGDDWGANGVDILNAHNEVSFNRFVNCEAPSYDFGAGGGAIEIYQMGDYTSIHHNWSFKPQDLWRSAAMGRVQQQMWRYAIT
jgi:hypothetical protein